MVRQPERAPSCMPWPPRSGPGAIWCWTWRAAPRPARGPGSADPRLRGDVRAAGPHCSRHSVGLVVGTKLLLLVGTAALAVHARLRLIPNLRDDNLSGLAHPWHHCPGERLCGGGRADPPGRAGLRGSLPIGHSFKPPLRWPRSPPC
jgi:hypothetical protein